MLVAVQEGVNSELWTGVFTMGLILLDLDLEHSAV